MKGAWVDYIAGNGQVLSKRFEGPDLKAEISENQNLHIYNVEMPSGEKGKAVFAQGRWVYAWLQEVPPND